MEPALRIVVVEDDPLLLADLAGTVRRGGHRVVATCGTVPEMVAAVRDHAPDVVVFDVHLHAEDGIAAFRSISRDHPCAGVAVTGDRSADTVDRAIANDVLAFVLKPVNPATLLTDVRLAAARHREMMKDRSEIRELLAAIDDPQGLVSRAKAKLMSDPINYNGVGAHIFLIRHAHREGVSVPRFAEMLLDNQFHVGVYCNRRVAGGDGPGDRSQPRRSHAHRNGDP